LLFLGRLHPKKGLHELLGAWCKVSKTSEAKDWILTIAGWGDIKYVRSLSERIHSLKLGNTVEYIGPIQGASKDNMLRNSDAFVLTSHSEGQPIAVIEALAYGVPALVSHACNMPDAIDGGAAHGCTTDPKSISEALLNLLALNDHQRCLMGIRGRQLIEKSYSWDVVAKKFTSVYEWLTGKRPTPECVSHV
jgi:poly(glycerol-phosphate) alpha-glucosyltransferase